MINIEYCPMEQLKGTAVSVGDIKILKWLIKKNDSVPRGSLSCALTNGHIDVFNFLAKKLGIANNKYYDIYIRKGHIDMIKKFHNKNYEMPYACTIAAESNQFEILKWLRSKNYPWNENVCYAAAKSKNFDILKWLYENGCPWDEEALYMVAYSGNLEILKWLYDSKYPFDKFIMLWAAESGNLDMVKYLYHNNFLISSDIYCKAVKSGNLKLIEWINQYVSINECNYANISKMYNMASKYRYYDVLKWLCKYDFRAQCDKNVAENIFENGSFEMLDWILENKITISATACTYIASYGRLDVLKKVKEYGCEWDFNVCRIAMYFGYVDIVRWAHNNKCEWRDCINKSTCVIIDGVCKFTEKSIKKWMEKKYNKEFNFIKISN